MKRLLCRLLRSLLHRLEGLESDETAWLHRLDRMMAFMREHGPALLNDLDHTGQRDAAPTLNARLALSALLREIDR
jgi:hypothetical protein